MLRRLDRFTESLARWTGVGVMVLMAAATALVAVSVLLRYVFSTGIDWGEELTRYIMIWMGFLGMSLALRKGAHAGIEMLRAALPLPIRRVVTMVAVLSILFFFSVVIYQGFILVGLVAEKESVVLPVSMAWFYLAIPVGSLLMLLQALPITIRAWQTGDIPRGSEIETRIV
jgi:TRAP-type C4-dicarboxylate transport system permease small subunit